MSARGMCQGGAEKVANALGRGVLLRMGGAKTTNQPLYAC